jgi:NhaP-type Na+/H+ or K+/H+ antiporter
MIVLPVVVLLEAVALNQGESMGGWLIFLARLFFLGPAAGFGIAVIAAGLMKWVRSRTTIRREYRALYGVGVLFAAYFTGTSLGSSGFLAVFTAGLATAVYDYDLCDCFLEYSEITTEMVMLLAFLLFGTLLSALIGVIALLPALIFALITLVVIRPTAIGIVLRKAPVSRQARRFIGWFGPRGLSSLLFGLLLASGGVPGSEQILAVAGVVVIISVILHGVSALPLAARYSRSVAKETLPEEREATAAGLYAHDPSKAPRITPQELAEKLNSSTPPIVLDVRSRSTYSQDSDQIHGSIRVLPDQIREWANGQPKDREMVAYCT